MVFRLCYIYELAFFICLTIGSVVATVYEFFKSAGASNMFLCRFHHGFCLDLLLPLFFSYISFCLMFCQQILIRPSLKNKE